MGNPLAQLIALLQGSLGADQSTVRTTSDGSLDTGAILRNAQIQPAQRSPYDRSFGPGEATTEDIRGGLADILLAAGSMAVPGFGGNSGSSLSGPASLSSRRGSGRGTKRSILAGGDRPAPSGETGGILSYRDATTGKLQYVDARDIKGSTGDSILAGGRRPAPSGQTGGIVSFWDPVAKKVIYVDARDLP